MINFGETLEQSDYKLAMSENDTLKKELKQAASQAQKYENEIQKLKNENLSHIKHLEEIANTNSQLEKEKQKFYGKIVPTSLKELTDLEKILRTTLTIIEQKKLETIAKDINQLKDQKLCIACIERDKCIAFAPCGHVSACEQCSLTLTQCPMCRQPIQNNMKVFI